MKLISVCWKHRGLTFERDLAMLMLSLVTALRRGRMISLPTLACHASILRKFKLTTGRHTLLLLFTLFRCL